MFLYWLNLCANILYYLLVELDLLETWKLTVSEKLSDFRNEMVSKLEIIRKLNSASPRAKKKKSLRHKENSFLQHI